MSRDSRHPRKESGNNPRRFDEAATQVLVSLQHNWPYLLASGVIATLLKLYVNTQKISAFLTRNRSAGVVAATTAAVTTPLCSCGTTAVVLGMMASTLPWAPIVAFMVSSPLSSPAGLVYSAGIFGWPFAIAFFVASILLGLGGGRVTSMLENRGWLANQTRFAQSTAPACACSQPEPVPSLNLPVLTVLQPQASCCAAGEATLPAAPASCGCATTLVAKKNENPRVSPSLFLKELLDGGKNPLTMFLGFAFIGYCLNGLIPAKWMSTLFGSGNVYSVPLAAILGLPFYINHRRADHCPLARGGPGSVLAQPVHLTSSQLPPWRGSFGLISIELSHWKRTSPTLRNL